LIGAILLHNADVSLTTSNVDAAVGLIPNNFVRSLGRGERSDGLTRIRVQYQELAGLAFSLAPLADSADSRGLTGDAAAMRHVIDRLRSTTRDLRALLVDLHPPNLGAVGLDSAIRDLVSPLSARGTRVSLAVNEEDQLDPQTQAILYRVAQEAVRNVIAYADAKAVSVEVGVADSIARLVVSDDGRGFEPEIREQRLTEGHLGLALLEELAQQAGGRLTVDSTVGVGTRIELEVPLG